MKNGRHLHIGIKTPKKRALSLWLALITPLVCGGTARAEGGADPDFHAPFFANADVTRGATAPNDAPIKDPAAMSLSESSIDTGNFTDIAASGSFVAGDNVDMISSPGTPTPTPGAVANDQCAGAIVIPPAGPFPHLTTAVNVTNATTTGDPPLPTCQTSVSRSIWYRFTPAVTGSYTISSCQTEAPASTLPDIVLAIYTGASCAGPFTQLPGVAGCDDDSCTTLALQAIISNTTLSAGTQYYILAHKFGTTAPTAGAASIQFRVSLVTPVSPTPTVTPSPTPPNLFGRLSTRAFVQTGNNVLIGGFVVTGTGTKKVLVRALGPSLTGVSGQLADPTLELRDGNGALLIANNDWQDNPAQAAQIIATGQAPTNNLESAVIVTIPPGLYTAIVSGNGSGTGVGIAQIIDVDTSTNCQLTNISSRAVAGTGDNVIVGGFTINGPQSQKVVIRGLGPTLPGPGLLQDPTLELRNSSGNTLVFNNNWRDTQEAAIQATGIPPTDNRESAMVATLVPGSYTAVLAGCNTTGVAVVEVYDFGLAGNMTQIPLSSSPCGPTATPTPPPGGTPTPTPPPGGTPTPTPSATPTLPVITSPLVATGTVGLPFTYQFGATGETVLAAGNLAPGLTFNASLGAITGIPTTEGIFQVALSASNSVGTTNATLTITVQLFPPSGPVIISSAAVTGRTGRAFSFLLQASGGSSVTRFAVDFLPPGLNLDSFTGFISGTPSTAGNFSLAVSAIDGTTIARGTLQLTLTSDPNFPVITSPTTITLAPGQLFTYSITADANATFAYIGSDGIVHQGASCAGLPAGLCFDGDHTISGTFSPPFASDGGSATRPDQTGGIIVSLQLIAANLPIGAGGIDINRLRPPTGVSNIATRLAVGAGENVLIGGFIIQGNAPKRVIIRAIGPSLTQFGVPNALADPVLDLNEGSALLSSNDNWRDSPGQATQIMDTGLQPSDGREAAILAYLDPGSYTAVVRGKNNSTGVALVEVYDGSTVLRVDTSNAKLANIATRGTVLGGDSVMIGGFIIVSPDTRVLIRAIGPSLTAFGISGALQDPTLELRNANGAILRANDDWGQGQPAEIQQAELAPPDPRESALVETLQPGNYTGTVRGKGGATGVAVVEGYVLSNP